MTKKLLTQDNRFAQTFLAEVRQAKHYTGDYKGTPYEIYIQGSDFWGTIGNQHFELDINANTFNGYFGENTFSGEINDNQGVGLINNFPWGGTYDDYGNFAFTWKGFALAANTGDFKDPTLLKKKVIQRHYWRLILSQYQQRQVVAPMEIIGTSKEQEITLKEIIIILITILMLKVVISRDT